MFQSTLCGSFASADVNNFSDYMMSIQSEKISFTNSDS